jgi:hypothetical protein
MRPNRHVTTYFRHVWTSLIKGTLYIFVQESPDLVEQNMTVFYVHVTLHRDKFPFNETN